MAKKQSKGGAKGPARAANVLLAKGIYAVSASTNARRKGQFKVATKGGPKKAAAPEAAGKAPRYYPADDVKTPLKRNFKPKSAKLRTAIVPGTVLILLSGRFRGKRVVFLKQLESGTLLVTGPYKVNGVPLRRVNQAYVIATSVTVDVSGVDVSGIEDAFFAKEAVEKAADEDKFFNPENQKPAVVPDAKKDAQKVDGALVKALSSDGMLKAYLGAKFSLTSKDRPHAMKF